MSKFLVAHAGTSYNAKSEGGGGWYAVQYGELRNVHAHQACNYSYREFWF